MAVKVVCDSTGYVPDELLAAYDIQRVSLSVVWGDKAARETEITDLDGFYGELREMKNLPTTSQPSVGEFLEVYRPIIEAGDEIYSAHFSSGISGTYQSAVQAKDQLVREGIDPGRITVLDTGLACGGYAAVVLAAAEKAKAGVSHDTVSAAAETMRQNLDFWFAIDTLEYLQRGGRIGAVASWVGTAIKIKPILTVTREGIIPVERVRTQNRVIARLFELAEHAIPQGGGYVVQHVQAPELAQRVADECRRRFGGEPLFVGEIGPVIGAHVGPGLIGIGVFPSGLIDGDRTTAAASSTPAS